MYIQIQSSVLNMEIILVWNLFVNAVVENGPGIFAIKRYCALVRSKTEMLSVWIPFNYFSLVLLSYLRRCQNPISIASACRWNCEDFLQLFNKNCWYSLTFPPAGCGKYIWVIGVIPVCFHIYTIFLHLNKFTSFAYLVRNISENNVSVGLGPRGLKLLNVFELGVLLSKLLLIRLQVAKVL